VVVEREIVEQVGNVDIELVADRHNARKTEPSLGRPLDHRCRDGAGLGNQCHMPVGGTMCRKTRIELRARHHHAQAIWPDQAHAMHARRRADSLGKRTSTVAEACRQDHGACDTDRADSTVMSGMASWRRDDMRSGTGPT
jgi:hypothetical protein